MPTTVPACCESRWRWRLMCGEARDLFVRSIKAVMYIVSATGMMRIQRSEVRDGLVSVLASVCSVVVIEITRLANVIVQTTDREQMRQPSKVSARAVFRIHESRRPY